MLKYEQSIIHITFRNIKRELSVSKGSCGPEMGERWKKDGIRTGGTSRRIMLWQATRKRIVMAKNH